MVFTASQNLSSSTKYVGSIYAQKNASKCFPYPPNYINYVMGTTNNEFLKGGKDRDWIFGYDGNDIIWGKAGNDSLYGDKGNDTLLGGIGNDYLKGGMDNDILIGGAGNDQLIGGWGNDIVVGGDGDDYLVGSQFAHFSPNEPIPFYKEVDVLYGGDGADIFALNTFEFSDGPIMPYSGSSWAIIKDFDRTEGDKILVLGSSSTEEYSFQYMRSGTTILKGYDRIAFVANAWIDPNIDLIS